jgi:glycosyltransferase involved in cell wall biosynthesis
MISVIMTLHNRAHLLKWGLQGLFQQDWLVRNLGKDLEIVVLDDGSTDGLDDLLKTASVYLTEPVKKWTWDRSQANIAFNCPAIPYNMLIKHLVVGEYILKMDPEMVLLDNSFLDNAMGILQKQPNAIVMPFPYHCKEFEINSLDDIRSKYRHYHYPTHITKENAKERMVYYMCLMRRDSYIKLGGVDERFSSGVGSEDDAFLDMWRREYGSENFIPLTDQPAVHLFHGGFAQAPINGQSVGVPLKFYPWVEYNSKLREQLRGARPNEGRDWGKLYNSLRLTAWEAGESLSLPENVCLQPHDSRY